MTSAIRFQFLAFASGFLIVSCFFWPPIGQLENQVLRFDNGKLLKGVKFLVEQRRVELLASALRTRRSAN